MRTHFPLRAVLMLVILASLSSCSRAAPVAAAQPPDLGPIVEAGRRAGACVIEPHAHCSELTLADENFAGGALRNADLHGADLSGADLREADLRYADLSRAIFDGASLSGASLAHADLSGASFKDADLRRADLRDATVSDATSFTGSFRCQTVTPDGKMDDASCPGSQAAAADTN